MNLSNIKIIIEMININPNRCVLAADSDTFHSWYYNEVISCNKKCKVYILHANNTKILNQKLKGKSVCRH